MARVRNSSMSIFGALPLSIAIDVAMMMVQNSAERQEGRIPGGPKVGYASLGASCPERVGVICSCLATASDPNMCK